MSDTKDWPDISGPEYDDVRGGIELMRDTLKAGGKGPYDVITANVFATIVGTVIIGAVASKRRADTDGREEIKKFGAGTVDADFPSLAAPSSPAPDDDARFKQDVDRFRRIFESSITKFMEHVERHPTEAELQMIAGAVLRHMTAPDAVQALQ